MAWWGIVLLAIAAGILTWFAWGVYYAFKCLGRELPKDGEL